MAVDGRKVALSVNPRLVNSNRTPRDIAPGLVSMAASWLTKSYLKVIYYLRGQNLADWTYSGFGGY